MRTHFHWGTNHLTRTDEMQQVVWSFLFLFSVENASDSYVAGLHMGVSPGLKSLFKKGDGTIPKCKSELGWMGGSGEPPLFRDL